MTKTPPNGTTPIHDRIQAEMLDSFSMRNWNLKSTTIVSMR